MQKKKKKSNQKRKKGLGCLEGGKEQEQTENLFPRYKMEHTMSIEQRQYRRKGGKKREGGI